MQTSTILQKLIKTEPIKQVRKLYIEQAIKLKKKPDHAFLDKCERKTCYAHIPWIKNLGDRLIEQISHSNQFKIIPLRIFDNPDNRTQRRLIIEYSRNYAEEYKRILHNWLSPVAKSLKGCIFTFDWLPVMRHVVEVCNELGIKSILVPHESVFFEEEKFYLDIKTGINCPITGWIYGWGDLQKEIFIKRGYPETKFIPVGAPKFDRYHDYQPTHSRVDFYNSIGFSPNKKTILFAAQTMDSQLNTEEARVAQQQAIMDVFEHCLNNDLQFILRYPPSNFKVLTDEQLSVIVKSRHCLIDRPASGYKFSPEETIYHCDLTTSVNSTMLFESMIIGKPAISVKYVDFQNLWQQTGIRIVNDKNKLSEEINNLLHDPKSLMSEWAINSFSPGAFDGKSTDRIIALLEKN